MEPYHTNIKRKVIENNDYRRVLYTVPKSFQLVCMSIPIGDNIHAEKHQKTTQFIVIEKGLGIATVNNKHYALGEGVSITIPPNVVHKIENVGDKPLKLYTIYTPPEHPDGLIQHTNLNS
jgi:mannose-6-phosphate isomerase-like protein (cupin superfamily)